MFTFVNASIRHNSHFAVYTRNEKKIDECTDCSVRDVFDVYPKNTSVLYRIINVTQNNSGIYWLSLFGVKTIPQQSNMVKLDVKLEKRSSTGKSEFLLFDKNN